jgi:hypothetical protein
MRRSNSAERERIGLARRIEKLELEQTVFDGLLLPDQLVHRLLVQSTEALVVDVASVGATRRQSVMSTRNRTARPRTAVRRSALVGRGAVRLDRSLLRRRWHPSSQS